MGLDIYFMARDNHQNGAVVETQEHQEVGAFRKVMPLHGSVIILMLQMSSILSL